MEVLSQQYPSVNLAVDTVSPVGSDECVSVRHVHGL